MKRPHRYLPQTEAEVREMLETIGVDRLEDLFEAIPRPYRLNEPLDLPEPLSEKDLLGHLEGLQGSRPIRFLGGGAYHHFIPAVVFHLASRSEFYTAYTPYQPEISQGTLQAIYEYQTLMCQLTGMEVSNASMYDGASSLAEAVLMSHRITGRRKILISEAVHPEYRQVVKTYLYPELEGIVPIPYLRGEGRTDMESLLRHLDQDVSAVILQNPNFFGVVEDLSSIGERVHQAGGLLIVTFSEAIAYGLLRPPGEFGADIVAGEGQSLGLPLSFGGPYLGIFTTRERFVRSMPGRLVGETVDLEGRRGFVLTLATREQHIRREKATSNICTNEGLCALMATIFLSCLGKEGLKELAWINLSKAEYLKKRVSRMGRCRLAFSGPTFNEFVLEVEEEPEQILHRWQAEGILGGLPLARFYPELDRHLLVTVTEMNTREEIDRWAELLEGELR
ncbi:MAG: aminomethyl-transferring glycine dehydrogenase subunit GcvPA [Desulfobacterota bacterium]|nr:aminomethyl-transferring glycine dehydrogenase subunit GcvPA [Thermodesulfobacteriota bacterium]